MQAEFSGLHFAVKMRYSKVLRWIAIGYLFFAFVVNAAEDLDFSWATLTATNVTSGSLERSGCISPRYHPGTCVPVTECPELLTPLRRPELSQNVRSYLQRALCYYYENQAPVVCCLRPGPQQRNSNRQPSTSTPAIKEETKAAPGTPVSNDANGISLADHRNAKLLPAPDSGACGEDSQDKVVGGKEVMFGGHPWMILLKYRKGSSNYFLCGGSLINDRYVLTAAHCLNSSNGYQLVSARVGEHNVSSDPDCIYYETVNKTRCAPKVQEIGIEKVIAHQDYTGKPYYYNDIGLIRLEKRAIINEHATPICLPFGKVGTRNLVDKSLSTAGWGWTEDRIASNVRLSVSVPVVNFEECAKTLRVRYIMLDKDKQMCAGGEKGKDSCSGDSGGCLMGLHTDAKWYCDGVVSFGGRFCGSGEIPTVYTRTSNYLTWILDTIQE